MSKIVWQKPVDFDPAHPTAEQADPAANPRRVGVSQSGHAAIVIDHETGDHVLYVSDAQTPPGESMTVVDWLVRPTH